MRFTVALIDPSSLRARQILIDTEAPCTAEKAARLAGVPVKPDTELAVCNVPVEHDHLMSEGERLDILSSLLIDPKKARALRAQNTRPSKRANVARHGGKHQLAK